MNVWFFNTTRIAASIEARPSGSKDRTHTCRESLVERVYQPVPTIQSLSFHEFPRSFPHPHQSIVTSSFDRFRGAVETDSLILDINPEDAIEIKIYLHNRAPTRAAVVFALDSLSISLLLAPFLRFRATIR